MREVSGKLSIDLGYLHTTREFDLHVENFDCASDESIAIAIQLAPWKASKPGKPLKWPWSRFRYSATRG